MPKFYGHLDPAFYWQKHDFEALERVVREKPSFQLQVEEYLENSADLLKKLKENEYFSLKVMKLFANQKNPPETGSKLLKIINLFENHFNQNSSKEIQQLNAELIATLTKQNHNQLSSILSRLVEADLDQSLDDSNLDIYLKELLKTGQLHILNSLLEINSHHVFFRLISITKTDFFRNQLSQSQKIELAKIVAKEKTLSPDLSEHIHHFDISPDTLEGQTALIEIAKHMAQQKWSHLPKFIQNYGIKPDTQEGRLALIEIAKLAAQQNKYVTSHHIQNYGINADTDEGQAALIEIAKYVALRDGACISEYIQNYGIKAHTPEGQAALIAIAKLAARDDGAGTSKFIQNYGIRADTQEGQAALIEIAKLAVQKNRGGVSEFIQNYGIPLDTPEGQAALIEIAEVAAQHNGAGTSKFIQSYGIKADTPEGQAALIKIAKLAAQQNGAGTSHFIQNYGIQADTEEGQTALIEIAKLAARQNGGGISKFIQKYGIPADTPAGQIALIEIAKLAAQQNGAGTSEFIQNYGIQTDTEEGQAALIEIAKLATQQKGSGPSEFIQNYGIKADTQKGGAALIEIAKLSAQRDGADTSKFIQNYGIQADTQKGQAVLIEIAKLAARQSGEGTSKFIQNYGIKADTPEGQAALIGIAKLTAQQNGGGTSKFIQNYGIPADTPEGEIALIEIAKLAVQHSGGGASKFIQKYGIRADTEEGQTALIQIATLAAQQNRTDISEFIQNYGIKANTEKGRAILVEIAKLAAQTNGAGTSKFIQNYGIPVDTLEGRATLIQIAKLSAQQNGSGASEFIQNYGIKADTEEGRAVLIEIAKLAAKQNGKGTSRFIQNYGIQADTPQGQAALIEIAKLAAKQSGAGTSEYIQNYGIQADTPQGQTALIEIAKLAFQKSRAEISLFIQNYEIKADTKEGQDALITIAKLSAQQDGYNTSQYIQNYGIQADTQEGQAALIEIARLAAQQDGMGTSKYFQNYAIKADTKERRKALITIAKLAAQQDGIGVSKYFQNYGIKVDTEEEQEALIVIAKLAVLQNGGALEYLPSYHIRNQKELLILTLIGLYQDFYTALPFLEKITFEREKLKHESIYFQFYEHLIKFLKGSNANSSTFNSKRFTSFLIDLGNSLQLQLEPIIEALTHKEVKGKKVPLDSYLVKKQLVWLAQSVCLIGSKEEICNHFGKNRQHIEKIFSKCASIHNPLLKKLIIKLSFDCLDHSKAASFFENCQKLNSREHFFLPQILSASLISREVDPKMIQQHLIQPIISLKEGIKDRKFNEALYRFIDYCHAHQALTPMDLNYLLEIVGKPLNKDHKTVYDKKEMIHRLNVLRNIGELGGVNRLKKEYLTLHAHDLNAYFLQLFRESVPVKEETNFSERYQETFASSRDPTAIIRYAAGLKTLPSPYREQALTALGHYVDSVLIGIAQFKEKRLETAENPHLKVIFEKHPNLKQIWSEAISRPLVVEEKEAAVLDVHKYFYDKVVTDAHIDLPLFKEYLKVSSEKKQLLYQALNQSKQLTSIEEAQKLLMESTQEPFHQATLQSKQALIQRVIALLSSGNTRAFLQDLNDFSEMLKPKEAPTSGFKIEVSDDPFDLLLCGTEILGSCQRVDGDPSLNKGLLGYLLDGKNRLIAIKTPDGKLKGRALLRLCWNETKQKPVLFLSRIYPSDLSQEMQQAIIKLAKERTEAMGVDLASTEVKESEQHEAYLDPIRGLGGPAPFEYVDEVDGNASQGVYEITQAYYLQKLMEQP